MEFIAKQLPCWRDHADRPAEVAETVLTDQLCSYLNSACYGSEAWSHVQFRTETRDETKKIRTIDLTPKPRAAVLFIEGRRHTQFDSLFPIECKRFPIPADRDEREYVITEPKTSGGIQRFKFGHHGAKHDFGGIIGFIQENTADFWLEKVNGWISDLSGSASQWGASDVLEMKEKDSKGRCCTYASRHARSGSLNDIVLHHAWISMN